MACAARADDQAWTAKLVARADDIAAKVATLRGLTIKRTIDTGVMDDAGLRIRSAGAEQRLPVDTVVVCAGQEPRRELHDALQVCGVAVPIHLIGGADMAAELDAKRAIDQGSRLAAAL